MPIERDRNIRLALSDEELQMAHEIADAQGTTITELLRRFLRKSHAKMLGGRAALKAARKGGKS